MNGNVDEWVQDTWHDNYKGAPDNGDVWKNGRDEIRRVLRGGSWGRSPFGLRSADRYSLTPGYQDFDIGFRVVCSPPSAR